MLDFLFAQWTKALQTSPAATAGLDKGLLPSNDPNTNASSSSSSSQMTPPITAEAQLITKIYKSLSWCTPVRLKHFSMALLTLRIARDIDPRLRNHPMSILFYDILESLEGVSFQCDAFRQQDKHVINVIGLPAVGKSTLMHFVRDAIGAHIHVVGNTMQQHSTEIMTSTFPFSPRIAQVLTSTDWQVLVDSLPPSLQCIIRYAYLYMLTFEILQCPHKIILIEGFYHQFLQEEFVKLGVDAANEEQAYAWPLDLPQPELILLLTTNTHARLQRVGKYANSVTEEEVQRTEPLDVKAQTIYSAVKGPGTVGIGCSGNIDETYNTIIEALDYFGVYAITRELPPIEEVEADNEAFDQLAWKDVPDEEGTHNNSHNNVHCEDGDAYDMYAALAGDASGSTQLQSAGDDYLDLLTDENAILLACGEVDAALLNSSDHNVYSSHPRASIRLSGAKRKRSTMMTASKMRKGRESLLHVAANPRASMEVISNRRTSIGVYGMFSKECLDQL